MELDSPRYGVRELHEASAQGDEAEITRLLSQDIHLLEARLGGLTPLMQALRERQNESIKILLDWGANANARSVSGLACMWYAMKSDRLDHVALLLKAGADPNQSNSIRQLMPNGIIADMEQDALDCTLFAVQRPTLDALHLLVAYGLEIDMSVFITRVCVKNAMRLNNSMHLLALLAFGKHRELAERTIDLEVTEEIKSIFDKWSSRTKDIECCPVLRQHIGANGALNYHSLLAWAIKNKQFETLEYVLDSKSDLEFLEMRYEGLSAIQYAARVDIKIVARLLERGAAINKLTSPEKGQSLLTAAKEGRHRTVRTLLKNGANILATTQDGDTVFDLAFKGRHQKTIQALDEIVSYKSNILDFDQRRRARKLFISSKAKHKPHVSYIVLDDKSDDASPSSANEKVKKEACSALEASDCVLPGYQ